MGSGGCKLISPTAVFILAFVVLSASPSREESSLGDKRSAYDVLGDYNFPIGILPTGVRGYDLDSSSGKFAAFFNGTCSFSLEGSYQLQYKSTIKGVISENRLTDLQGVKVKILFVWVDIVEVRRSGDNLQFSVGIAGADFPIDNFFECPQCGCGLDCDDPNIDGWADSDRGVSCTLGANKVIECLEKNDLNLISRGHQVIEDRYEFYVKQRRVMIFSGPNYSGEFNNAGAFLGVDENLVCAFKILKPEDPKASTGTNMTLKLGRT